MDADMVDERLLPGVLLGDADILEMNDTRFKDIAHNLRQAADWIESHQRKLAEAERDQERLRRAYAGYKANIVQSSSGRGYVDVFMEIEQDAARRGKEGK